MIREGEARAGAVESMGKRVCGECADDLGDSDLRPWKEEEGLEHIEHIP